MLENFGSFFLWAVFIIFLILTPLYFLRTFTILGASSIVRVQIFLPTLSFAGWAFALGGPFRYLTWYKPVYGALALTVITFLTPAIYAPAMAVEKPNSKA